MGKQNRARRVFYGIRSTVRGVVQSDPAKRRMTEAIPIVDEKLAQRIIDLAMRIAAVMLSVGASAKEVMLATLRVTSAYGLRNVHVDVTFTSVTVSDHREGAGNPITLMQVVRSARTDHAKLQRLQALVTDIEGGLSIIAATQRFHAIRRTPFMYRSGVIVAVSALLAVAVAVMFQAGWVVLLSVLLAGLSVALVQHGLKQMRVPAFFTQVIGGFVLTAITVLIAWLGRMGIEPFVDVRSGLVVSSGIILMLAGLAVVGAAQDAIDGFSLTATGRILDLTVMTMGVVVGILAGLELAKRVGIGVELPGEAFTFGGWPYQLFGAVVIAAAVSVVNGGGLRILLVSAALGGIAWAGSYLGGAVGMPSAVSVFTGALLASLVGVLLASRLAVPAVAVTTAAIIPMVPGAAVFHGLLGVVQSGADVANLTSAFDSLFGAAMVGIALASGVTLGTFLGSPLSARIAGRHVRLRFAPRAGTGAGGTAEVEVVPPAVPADPPSGARAADAVRPGQVEPPPITRPFRSDELG